MRKIANIIEGNLVLTEDTTSTGIIEGSVDVGPHVLFDAHGIINGHLTLREESSVKVHGIVNGNILNDGGCIEIFGMVNGTVTTDKGETIIDPNAVIRSKT